MRRIRIFDVIVALWGMLVAMFKRFFAWARPIVQTKWTQMRTWYMGLAPKPKNAVRLAAIAASVLAVWFIVPGTSKPSAESTPSTPTTSSPSGTTSTNPSGTPATTVNPTPAQQKFTPYKVGRGEYIIAIAKRLGVSWESVVVANERDLATRAAERCAKLADDYTKRPGRRGHYCNSLVVVSGRPMMHANSLLPGDILQIPSVTAPERIQQVITNLPGSRIVVVIDDTGSMNDDRERVAAWYMQAVRNSGKEIAKVILYADGFIREYDAGQVRFFTSGEIENTRGALEKAASYKPDAIVLVSDEPGNDWASFQHLRLPPVIAHSLHYEADGNLAYVAKLTGGTFLSSHNGPIGLATTSTP